MRMKKRYLTLFRARHDGNAAVSRSIFPGIEDNDISDPQR